MIRALIRAIEQEFDGSLVFARTRQRVERLHIGQRQQHLYITAHIGGNRHRVALAAGKLKHFCQQGTHLIVHLVQRFDKIDLGKIWSAAAVLDQPV